MTHRPSRHARAAACVRSVRMAPPQEGEGARQERETQERSERENKRWASDEWGCRAVATNRQNQG